LRAMAEARARRQEQQRDDAEAAQTRAYNHEREDRLRSVGRMIADHHCTDARNVALTSGDLELAKQVDGLCPPGP
jgi:hypothetical protein